MTPKILLVLLLNAPMSSWAQESAGFLKLGVGARASGMGAYTAVADDVSAIAWNPAGLSRLERREVGATHAELYAGTRYDFLAYAQPTRYGTFGAAAAYLSQGGIPGRDAFGKPTGDFKASDQAVSLSYGSRLPFLSGSRLGGSLKYIRSAIAGVGAQSLAMDFGGQYQWGRSWGPGVPAAGISVQNIGPGLKFLDRSAPLPLMAAMGLGYRLPMGISLAADFRHWPRSRSSQVSVGTEYAFFSNFAVRAGYGGGLVAGFGVKAFNYSLDYSMTPFGDLGNTQRFTLGARF